MTVLFTGHALAARLNAETRCLLRKLPRPACLVVLHDPSDAAAAAYVGRIEGFAAQLGVILRPKPYGTMAAITDLAADPGVDAIIPMSPLPASCNGHAVTRTIGAARDADGQHPLNLGAVALGGADIAPPTAQAALLCAAELAGDLRGRRVAVVGASSRVGRPLALLLLDAGATVCVAQEHTRDLAALTRDAEIVISATGIAGLITADHIAQGAILLDIGIIRTPQGLVGDIDRGSVMGRAAALSCVPDGVGPVTTACLMRNVARLAAAHAKIPTGPDVPGSA